MGEAPGLKITCKPKARKTEFSARNANGKLVGTAELRHDMAHIGRPESGAHYLDVALHTEDPQLEHEMLKKAITHAFEEKNAAKVTVQLNLTLLGEELENAKKLHNKLGFAAARGDKRFLALTRKAYEKKGPATYQPQEEAQ